MKLHSPFIPPPSPILGASNNDFIANSSRLFLSTVSIATFEPKKPERKSVPQRCGHMMETVSDHNSTGLKSMEPEYGVQTQLIPGQL